MGKADQRLQRDLKPDEARDLLAQLEIDQPAFCATIKRKAFQLGTPVLNNDDTAVVEFEVSVTPTDAKPEPSKRVSFRYRRRVEAGKVAWRAEPDY